MARKKKQSSVVELGRIAEQLIRNKTFNETRLIADNEQEQTAFALFLRGIFGASEVVRIKLIPEFPSDDFNRRWSDLPPELQNKWQQLARLVLLGASSTFPPCTCEEREGKLDHEHYLYCPHAQLR